MSETQPSSAVVEFFNHSKILITGGTGFVGKLLLEKLLRVCTGVEHVYLVVRVKKGKEPIERLKELLQDPVFTRIRNERPDFDKKVSCIAGNCCVAKLGISEADRQFLAEQVTHVFHVAATVRFDEHLKHAVHTNVLAVQEMIKFCRTCARLKAIVHVSTAYSNCPLTVIEEKFYDPPLTGENALKLVEALDDSMLATITPQIIAPWPNTYAFTKAIAENVVRDQGRGLPIAVFRPSIIISAAEEPVKGFIDNIYGPAGVCAAVGAGLMRVLCADGSKTADLVPADYVVNALICAAWDASRKFNHNDAARLPEDKEILDELEPLPPIYNYVSSADNPITWKEYLEYSLNYGRETPTIKGIWYYTMTLTKMRWLYNILVVLLHLIPAIIMDGWLRLTGKKPQMWRGYQRIHKLSEVLEFFATRSWKFSDDSVQRLWWDLNETDKKLFAFDVKALNWETVLRSQVAGVRKYLFQDDPKTIPAARKKMIKFHIAHRAVQFCFIALCYWVINFTLPALFYTVDRIKMQSAIQRWS